MTSAFNCAVFFAWRFDAPCGAAVRRVYGRFPDRRWPQRKGILRADNTPQGWGTPVCRRDALPRVCPPARRAARRESTAVRAVLRKRAAAVGTGLGRGPQFGFRQTVLRGRIQCFGAFINKKAPESKKIRKNTEINIDKSVRKC